MAYMQMADSLYKQIRYTEAIKLYEQADYYALKNHHNKERFVINYFLSDIYRSIGFSNKANEYWEVACSFFNSLDRTDSSIMTNLYKARRMEHSNQFYLAILYRQENINLLKKKYLNLPESKPFIFQQKIDLALEHNIIAYDYLKNSNLHEAKKNIEKTELYLKDVNIATHYQTPIMICVKQ
jgi:tetratricopeptide (TPR) repeat protein